ncbi:DNA polymerase III subunit delta' [Paracoccaceae bacterium]|nr:DNA polymerase III subunit delta' [Paracoccaceae bacterium]
MSDEPNNFFSDKIAGAPHPMLANEIIGHSSQKLSFLSSFASNRLHQCWLLAGDMGIGKASFAWLIAKFLLTTKYQPADLKIDLNESNINSILEPQSGNTLNRIISGSEQRVYIVRRGYNEKRKTFFKNISIEDVRKLQSYCSLSIADGGRRIIIIDTADDLNKSSSNALLKLLEEPPKNTIFLLISHQPNLLVPTLKSRCQKLSFSNLDQTDLGAVLKAIGCKIERSDEVSLSILSKGSAGAACRLINSNCINLYSDILNISSSLPNLNTNKILQLSQNYFAKAKPGEFEIFLEMMQHFFSRLCKTGAMQKPVLPSVTENEAKIMKNLCPNLKSAHFWSEAANITLAKLNKGYLLNIDIESLILEAFVYLEKSYQTIYQTRITNE